MQTVHNILSAQSARDTVSFDMCMSISGTYAEGTALRRWVSQKEMQHMHNIALS